MRDVTLLLTQINLMKRILLAAAVVLTAFSSCRKQNEIPDWASLGIETARSQLLLAAELVEGTGRIPGSLTGDRDPELIARQLGKDVSDLPEGMRVRPARESVGSLASTDIHDWISGFYPGSLWYVYELTGDEAVREKAVEFTNLLGPLRSFGGTHDIGFMVGCSFGNALRLSPADTVRDVIVQAAGNLAARFNPTIGCTLSWSPGRWNYPVIIDNMMNLELLFTASRLTGDPKYRDIAVTHANTTLRNHFRDDYTSFHVVSYNDDGTVQCRQTMQGRSDGSAWARGQAWGLYGFTMCFRETGDSTYLAQAEHIADMIMERVTTEDAVPYWDYDAPALEETPRDASAGAITASAMMELCTFTGAEDSRRYFAYGEKILRSLSSETYLSKPGENHGFVLMHSTGALPLGGQIDVPLNFADYYYLEGLKRYAELLRKRGH